MPLNVALLRRDMNQLAVETWQKIDTGDRQGTRFREDSLTDHNLWILARDHPGLNLRRFNQSEEKSTGADWEWWIGADSMGWICLKIQAKRNYGASYPRLDHPGDSDGDYQYDTLINSCSRDGEYPLHVFYNGWSRRSFGSDSGWPQSARWRACTGNLTPPKCRHAHTLHYGCAIVSSFAVRAVHSQGGKGRRLVEKHLSNALPWSYLFGRVGLFGRFKTDGPEPVPNHATSDWLDWMQLGLDAMVREWQVGTPRRGIRQSADGALPRLGLPFYADAVRRGSIEDSVVDVRGAPTNAARVIVLDVDAGADDGTEEEEGDPDPLDLWY